jgi:RND family efflux transporter MFP subunit
MFAVACGEEGAAPELPLRAIQWLRVGATAGDEQRIISGIVTAVADTKLAFDIGGTVASVEVGLGQVVEKDQVLARLDAEPFELTVRDAEAVLAQARARYAEARVTYDRTIALFAADVASASERDRAVALHDASKSGVEAAEARLSLAQRDLRRSVLRAPFGGAISVKRVDPAQEVLGGQVVIEMDSGESGLRVEVQVPETLITRVKQGREVEVTFPTLDGRSFAALVSEVGTRADVGNAFTVKADFVERISELRPGMTAEVRFNIPRFAEGPVDYQGLMIPFSAVRSERDNAFSVFIYDPETSTVRRRPIQPGGVRENDVAVLEGLVPGEVIATAGVSFLRDGQKVTLLEQE